MSNEMVLQAFDETMAAEMKRLKAEIKRLRKALEDIVADWKWCMENNFPCDRGESYAETAAEALEVDGG
jgi:hypothetical protein